MKYLWASLTTKTAEKILKDENWLKRSSLADCAVNFSCKRMVWSRESITFTKPPGFLKPSVSRG